VGLRRGGGFVERREGEGLPVGGKGFFVLREKGKKKNLESRYNQRFCAAVAGVGSEP